ncbi:Rossmann-like domain-containing protein [Desulfotomaculum copahuensis]|uniref:Putative heavy-metal chelation domain-containing protein n=1 Tax=Desulfotomaculum copahuensis TaxID=1838280 RepID=A0A1B7LB45_9FIRM|nr:DUF364 domain-containing protein [Desulfotomaculum copahuensis]OAT79530.1 hypothetical protein A6M21_15650 [Desulfotomaculum copahuensis]
MTSAPVYEQLRKKLAALAGQHDLLNERVNVQADILTAVQAIGRPERQDFPLLKGKEKMVEADLQGAKGQAFTNRPGFYRGTLAGVLELTLDDNFERAIFVAALNALCRRAGLVENTRHCRNQGPAECGRQVIAFLQGRYGKSRLGMVGLQPALLAACAPVFPLRVVDLDPENIGQKKEGVLIEDGETAAGDMVEWAQVLFVTGSTLVNDTIDYWLNVSKPVVFYGNTIAGAAALLGLQRYCPCST